LTHWVFDLDGTLVDSFSQYHEALGEVFAAYDVGLTKADFEQCLHVTARQFLHDKLGPENVKKAYTQLTDISLRDTHKVSAFKGIDSLLKSLQAKGVELSLWTNRDRGTADEVLRHLNLQSFFSTSVTGTCVTNVKPHPEGLHKILEHFGCGPEDIVMVGDHDIDMRAAKSGGVRAIRVSWASAQLVPRCQLADDHFHRVDDLHGWIDKNL